MLILTCLIVFKPAYPAEEFSSASRSVKPGLVCSGIVGYIIISYCFPLIIIIGICLDMECYAHGIISCNIPIWYIWRMVVRGMRNVSKFFYSPVRLILYHFICREKRRNYILFGDCVQSKGERQWCKNFSWDCQSTLWEIYSSYVLGEYSSRRDIHLFLTPPI